MKVLSLFDGISCGMVALERAGISVERYVAYEIEEDAIKVSKHNYPQIEHKGDVFEAKYTEGEFDILIGGSPCTHWSISRQGGWNRETQASGLGWDLFCQYTRALREVKPRWFLYENNESMSDDIKNAITHELGVEPVMIDSADFSAQQRKRYYWTNISFSTDWEKSELVFDDIIYEGEYKYRSYEKYVDTVKWNKNHTVMKYDTSGKGYYSQANRCRVSSIKMNTLPSLRAADKCNIYVDDKKFRLCHPVEAERLQTLPDHYTNCIESVNKRMGLCGNGWTVDVITHILRGLHE